MASIKVVLDTRSIRKDGTSPIKFRVSISRDTSFYISLDHYSKPSSFDKYGGKNGQTWVTDNKMINIYIAGRLNEAQNELIQLEHSGMLRHMNQKDIKISLCRASGCHCKELEDERINETESNKDKRHLLKDVFLSFCDLKIGRTKEIYLSTINKLKKILPQYDTIEIEDINKNWLIKIQKLLCDGNSVNSAAIHMRNIRAVINYAIDEEMINKYPFRKFKIQTQRTAKRSLTFEQFKMLRDFPCEGTQNEYRDMFLLIFYLIGINISDLVTARKHDVIDGRLSYNRNKTHKLYSIKIEPEAMDIIDRYSGKDLLVCPMERYKDIKQYNRRMNEGLQNIGTYTRSGLGGKKSIDAILPELTTYWARHTWATFAHKIGISKDVISMALGHSFGASVTDTYIEFDMQKVDEANRLVIDYVNQL